MLWTERERRGSRDSIAAAVGGEGEKRQYHSEPGGRFVDADAPEVHVGHHAGQHRGQRDHHHAEAEVGTCTRKQAVRRRLRGTGGREG